MKISKLLNSIESLKRIIGYDAEVVLFANGYTDIKIDLSDISVPGRFEDCVIISGEDDRHPSLINCVDAIIDKRNG